MSDDEFDVDALEEAEYEEGDYTPYTGPIPPKGTILTGTVKKAWWSETQYGDRMMKVIFEADEDSGEYEGLGVWDNITFNTKGKWRWAPFLAAAGFTLLDIKKKAIISDDDDSLGAPIEKIGRWVPGEGSAAIRIITDRERRDGEWQAKVAKWLPYEDPDEYVEDEEEVEEEEPAPPVRTARKAAAPRKAAKRPEPEEEEDGPESDEEEEDEPPARPARAARPKAARASAAPRSGGRVAKRRPAAGYDDEPPF
jgi:hypothetical protein